jgi:LPXTG-motif cell wall-anchored protein
MRRAWKRSLAVFAAPALAFLVGMFAWTGAASAHDVSDIEVDCTHVTVHFRDFPAEGVMVHIAATVQGHAELGTDVMVSGTMTGTLNISSATSALAGASATVNVDVTWSYHGDHHESATKTVTCGTATTTTTHATTTTMAPTTTVAPATTVAPTTTTAPGETTSTTAAGSEGGSTSTTVASGTVTGETTTVEGAATGGTSGSVAVLGETATAGTGSSTLPHTGSATAPLAGIGALALLSGLAALPAARRRLRA